MLLPGQQSFHARFVGVVGHQIDRDENFSVGIHTMKLVDGLGHNRIR